MFNEASKTDNQKIIINVACFKEISNEIKHHKDMKKCGFLSLGSSVSLTFPPKDLFLIKIFLKTDFCKNLISSFCTFNKLSWEYAQQPEDTQSEMKVCFHKNRNKSNTKQQQ